MASFYMYKIPRNPVKSHELSEIAGHKNNLNTSVALLYVSNEQSENDIKKTIPF